VRHIWIGGRGQAAKASVYIVAEAGLAHFAVVDDVDAALDLLLYGFLHGALDSFGERRTVIGLPAAAGAQHVSQVIGPRQGTLVRDENAVGAPFHDDSRPPGCRLSGWP
jgi:hypothetical protein